MQIVPLNDKVVGFTKLSKTQRVIGLFCVVLKSDLHFLNIFSANKVVIVCSVDLYIMFVKLKQFR
jgi:hypothetical protein